MSGNSDSEQKVCTFDNGFTMCRERWVDGVKVSVLAVELLQDWQSMNPEDLKLFFVGQNLPKPFLSGQVIGDREAMKQEGGAK